MKKILNLTLAFALTFQSFLGTGIIHAEVMSNEELVESVEEVENLNNPSTDEMIEDQEPIAKEEVPVESEKVEENENPPKAEKNTDIQLISEDEDYGSSDYVIMTEDGIVTYATAYVGEHYRIPNTGYDFSSIIPTWKTSRGMPKLYANNGGVEYTAFCIEPGVMHETGGNMSSGYNGLTQDQRDKIDLILMYGFGNNGDWSDDSYVATQVAIWEVVANQPSWGMLWGQLVQRYDNRGRLYSELLENVDKHLVRPSFMNDDKWNPKETSLDWNGSEYTKTLTDTNGVLSKYNVVSDNGDVNVSQNGNQLTLKTTNPNANVTLKLTKRATTGGNTLYWVSSTKQDIVTGGQDDPVNAYLKIKVNSTGTYEIIKKSTNGLIIEGAEFRITGSGYDQTFKTDKNGRINATNIPTGRYTVTEISVPLPYIVDSTPKTIEIKPNQTTSVEFINDFIKGGFSLLKTSDSGMKLENVEFALYDSNDQFIEILKTNRLGVIEKANLPYGDYYLVEVKTTNGHQLSKNPIHFSINKHGATISLTAVNNRTRVDLLKVDENNNPLSGATLQVLKKDGTLVEEWISTNNAHEMIGLEHGEYIFREIKAPSGYMLMADVAFTVTDEAKTVIVKGQDLPTVTELLKVDQDGNPLAGAVLQVLTKDGQVVEEWTSTDQAHEIVGLAHGKYIFREVSAPSGYILMEDVEFVVTDKQEILKVQGVDLPTYVSILKVDENHKPLVGATLQVLTKDGQVVEEWVSTDQPHEFIGLAHGEYILHEVSAPSGYVLMEDIQFKVTDDRNPIAITGQDLQTEIEILKVNQEDIALEGATLQLYQINENGEEILVEEWISTDKAHDFTGLAHGQYVVREVSAPSGYMVMDEVRFEVDDKPQTVKVQGIDLPTRVEIDKFDKDGNKLFGATMQIINKETGEIVEEWTTTDETKVIEGLSHGDYILREITAPDGFQKILDIEFTVNDEQKVTVLEVVDELTRVEIDKFDQDGNKLFGATMQIINKETGEIIEEWTTTDETKVIEGLSHGDYILREITAPNGFQKILDIEFTVNDDNGVTILEVTDELTKTVIEKVDEKGRPVKGSHLQIINENGEVVREFITDGKLYVIEGLEHGTYTLHEVSAPDGYELAEDIKFTVTDENGEITITMIDEKIKIVPVTGLHGNLLGGISLIAIGSALALKKRKRNN